MDGSSDIMAQDPNKQTFPLIGGAIQQYVQEDTTSSPSKEVESLTSGSKSSLELPRLIPAKEELSAVPAGRDQDFALKPSLPLVRKSRYSRSGPRPDPDRDELAERFEQKDPMPYQACNFRSSTVMKSVSIQKKKDLSHLTIKSVNLPTTMDKKRMVPVHTEPFLWSHIQQAEKPVDFESPSRSKSDNLDTTLDKNRMVTIQTVPYFRTHVQPAEKPVETVEGQSLPEKFLAEKERLYQVRGQKRRMVQPIHRQKYSDLHIGGLSPSFSHRLDYKGECDLMKQTILPKEAQDIYLGRGIKLPQSHGTHLCKKQWEERIKEEAALPSSAPLKNVAPNQVSGTRRQSITVPSGVRHRTDRHQESDPNHVPPSVRRAPPKPKVSRRPSHQDDSGVSTTEGSPVKGHRADYRPPEGHRSNVKRSGSDVQRTEKGRSEEMKERREPNKKNPTTQVNREKKTRGEEGDDGRTEGKDEMKMEENEMEEEEQAEAEVQQEASEEMEETHIILEHDDSNDMSLPRPDSEMDIEEPLDDPPIHRPVTQLSPTPKPPSPNPLMSADLHLNITAEKRDELALKFTKLDGDKDGHITFRELETSFPKDLSRPQQRYIKEAYDLVSSQTFFGLEEFVTISCLCERLAKLSGQPRQAFESLDMSTLQQEITQFVVMFSNVDRQQTGCINLDSFKELLAMVLNKDLASSDRLFNDILSGIGKTGSLSIDKVEYLVFIPYFLSFK